MVCCETKNYLPLGLEDDILRDNLRKFVIKYLKPNVTSFKERIKIST